MSDNMNSSSASPSIPTSTFPKFWHSIATARIHIETLMAGWAIPEFLTYIRGHPTLSNEFLELARETTINPDTELPDTDTPPDSNVSFEAADPDDSGDEGEHTAGDRLHLKAFFMFGLEQEWVSPHIHWIWWRQCEVKRENLKRRVQEQEETIYEQERLIEELEQRLREEEDLEEETYRRGFLVGEKEGRGEVYREEGRLLQSTLEEEGRSGWRKGREDGLTIGRKQGRREMFEVMNHSGKPPSGKRSRQEETEARGEDSLYYTMREMVFWGK
ncbi:hypothetical protein BGX38DRAFT_1140489 [Terfezia claveryi]|nr:hypothetical protein BGX38DRAFT_1140489 [Terfezia claveryi]